MTCWNETTLRATNGEHLHTDQLQPELPGRNWTRLEQKQQNSSKVYKTAKYEYKSSSSSGGGGGGTGPSEGVSEVYQRNINQLDTLLNDLERERDSSLDRSE